MLKNVSIQRKLMVIIMLTTVLAVSLASVAYLVYDYQTFQKKIITDLETLAKTLRDTNTENLVFNDRDSADRILGSLEVQSHIVAAWIFAHDSGEVFSEYRRSGSSAASEGAPRADGTEVLDDRVIISRSMQFSGRELGSFQIEADLDELQERRANILKITVGVAVSVLLVAFVVSALLARLVSQPILDLVKVVKVVSDRKNYTVRATKGGNDELGKLIDGFNEMLGQIELRDEELRVARDRAEQANRSKSVFLANMSHELRTPLTAIIGYSEILADDAQELGMNDFLPDLEKIHTAGKHLLGLINSILDLSKVEAGKMDLLPEKFEVPRLIEEVKATAQPLMEKSGNAFEVRVGESVGRALNDLTKTRQILLNLLSNAAKFTEKGRVVLEVERRPGERTDFLIMRVTDTGIGMTQEQLQRLFKPFSQADASTARNYGGTGLGLALSKRFAEMMQGKIKVESEQGQGSVFTLTLPTDVVAAKQHERSVSQMLSSGEWTEEIRRQRRALGADAPLVLVIDDDLAVQDLLQELLIKEGFRVATAKDGDEGLRMARELRPAIITLDVKMPGKDGWTVLTALKSDADLSSIPVIMISVADEQQKGYALGADYLTKPIDRARLGALLQKYRGQNATPIALVVDDDPNIRGVLARLLEEQSWAVDEAEDGIAALRRVAESQPTLILLDLMMPRMDGFDFVTHLRKNSSWRQIPVVVLTAMDLGPEELQRLNGGVEKVLEKGAYSLDELKSEIRALARDLMAA